MDTPTAIGIQIGATALRWAALQRSGGAWAVAASEIPRPAPDADAEPPVCANGAHCLAALPAADVLTRRWELPAASDAQFRQMVAHRLEADLPQPLDQFAWGYRTLGARGGGPCVALVQAARSAPVTQHLHVLATAGFAVDTLTTEAEALAALYRHGIAEARTSGPDVLILADADQWLVAVLADGQARAVRRVRVVHDELEAACRQCQQLIEHEVSRRALARVLWCAWPAQPRARAALAHQLDVPVEPVTPAAMLVSRGGQPLDVELLATFGPAIGLALAAALEPEAPLRLAGRTRTAERAPGRLREWIIAHPVRWVVAAAGAALLAGVLHVAALATENGAMRATLAVAEAEQAALADLQPKVAAMQRLDAYRIDVAEIAAHIARTVPNSITLSSLQLARDRRLVIKGRTDDPQAVYRLADALRQSSLFGDVSPEGTEPGGGFTLSIELTHVQPLPGGAGGRSWR